MENAKMVVFPSGLYYDVVQSQAETFTGTWWMLAYNHVPVNVSIWRIRHSEEIRSIFELGSEQQAWWNGAWL